MINRLNYIDQDALPFGHENESSRQAAFLNMDAIALINSPLDQWLNVLDTAIAYPGSQAFSVSTFRRGIFRV